MIYNILLCVKLCGNCLIYQPNALTFLFLFVFFNSIFLVFFFFFWNSWMIIIYFKFLSWEKHQVNSAKWNLKLFNYLIFISSQIFLFRVTILFLLFLEKRKTSFTCPSTYSDEVLFYVKRYLNWLDLPFLQKKIPKIK